MADVINVAHGSQATAAMDELVEARSRVSDLRQATSVEGRAGIEITTSPLNDTDLDDRPRLPPLHSDHQTTPGPPRCG